MPLTGPPSVCRSSTSPTSNCPSRAMNSPARVSFTTVCAPKPERHAGDARAGEQRPERHTQLGHARTNRTVTHATICTVPAIRPITVARRAPDARSAVLSLGLVRLARGPSAAHILVATVTDDGDRDRDARADRDLAPPFGRERSTVGPTWPAVHPCGATL